MKPHRFALFLLSVQYFLMFIVLIGFGKTCEVFVGIKKGRAFPKGFFGTAAPAFDPKYYRYWSDGLAVEFPWAVCTSIGNRFPASPFAWSDGDRQTKRRVHSFAGAKTKPGTAPDYEYEKG
jgi:hypothetical protein